MFLKNHVISTEYNKSTAAIGLHQYFQYRLSLRPLLTGSHDDNHIRFFFLSNPPPFLVFPSFESDFQAGGGELLKRSWKDLADHITLEVRGH